MVRSRIKTEGKTQIQSQCPQGETQECRRDSLALADLDNDGSSRLQEWALVVWFLALVDLGKGDVDLFIET